jgi:hypothetical protein
MSTQSQAPQIEYRAALEGIPHLARKICSIWGSAELDVYLSGLIMDSRDGSRQGFPVDVAEEILLLIQVNKMIRAIDLAKKLSMTLGEAYRRIDDGDTTRQQTDALDDPNVSRDTLRTRPQKSALAERRAVPRDGGNQGLAAVLTTLIRSKWVWGALILLVAVNYLWPLIKALR